MNNELGRKITSLTLMTIMVAGGMTFAVPGVMPAAHAANANLFVSAENSQFDNYMSGPQVIEVVVIDSDINDTDQAKGEPDVTVNGKILRMVQGVDGNWYGYFADRTQALIADSTSTVKGAGLNFGEFCGNEVTIFDGSGTARVAFTDTVGVAFPTDLVTGVNGTGITEIPTTQCGTDVNVAANTATGNVVREAKDPVNEAGTVAAGQLNIDPDLWPFVQLYPLNPTGNVIVQYNKGGGVQSTTLTFDTVDQFAGAELDRTIYPQGSQVHATITDLWLNIDPTDEDSWTFGAITNGSATTNYQVFDENGAQAGDAITGGVLDISDDLPALMCEDNCVLLLNTNTQGTGDVLTLQDNDDSALVRTPGILASNATAFATASGALNGTLPVTITEQGPNSGVFGTYDESDVSVLKIIDGAKRGTSATVDYNETPVTVLVGHSFGTVDIKPIDDEWSSGEEIPVEVVDNDANRNSRADEDLDLNDPSIALIPSLRTGDPFTLGESDIGSSPGLMSSLIYPASPTLLSPVTFAAGSANVTTSSVEAFSYRALITPTTNGTGQSLVIDLQATAGDLRDSINNATSNTTDPAGFKGFNLLNIDVRSFTTEKVDVYLLYNTTSPGDIVVDVAGANAGELTSVSLASTDARILATGVDRQSLTLLNTLFNSTVGSPSEFLFNGTVPDRFQVGLLIDAANPGDYPDATLPVVSDFFSFGFEDDGNEAGERVANQIVRIEAEETGDNSGIFEGSLEYVMLNQLNILDSSTYEDLSTIADDPGFIVIEDLTDEDAPRVNYLDLGAGRSRNTGS